MRTIFAGMACERCSMENYFGPNCSQGNSVKFSVKTNKMCSDLYVD